MFVFTSSTSSRPLRHVETMGWMLDNDDDDDAADDAAAEDDFVVCL